LAWSQYKYTPNYKIKSRAEKDQDVYQIGINWTRVFSLVYFHTEGSCQDPLIFGTVVINTGCQVHLGNVHGVNNPLLIYGGHVSVPVVLASRMRLGVTGNGSLLNLVMGHEGFVHIREVLDDALLAYEDSVLYLPSGKLGGEPELSNFKLWK
jgi:hypothetical protein